MIVVLFIIIGFPIGYVAGTFYRNKGFGLEGNTVIGVIGAILGGMLFNGIGVGFLPTLGLSAASAVALLFITNSFLVKG